MLQRRVLLLRVLLLLLPRLRQLLVRSPRVLQRALREEQSDASMYFLASARSRCQA